MEALNFLLDWLQYHNFWAVSNFTAFAPLQFIFKNVLCMSVGDLVEMPIEGCVWWPRFSYAETARKNFRFLVYEAT